MDYEYIKSPFSFFDYCLYNQKKEPIIIKYFENADSLTRDKAEVIKKFINVFDCTFFIISEKVKNKNIKDNLILKRHDLDILNKRTFFKLISQKNENYFFIYKYRSKRYIRIDGSKLKELRKKRNLSIKDLANFLEISPEAVNMYEKNKINMEYKKFLKLFELFSKKELKNIIIPPGKYKPIIDEDIPKDIIDIKFKEKGYSIYYLEIERVYRKNKKRKMLIKNEFEQLNELSKILKFEYFIFNED